MPDSAVNARTPATMVSGFRNTAANNANRIKPEIADEILLWQPNASPYLTLTGKMRDKRSVTQMLYGWFEKDIYPRTVTAAAAALAADTSLSVAAGTGVRVGTNYVLMNVRTREQVLVTAVSTDTLTIVRAIGSTAAAIEAGDDFIFTRAVFEEGSDSGSLKSVVEAYLFNYTETIKTAYGFTGRQEVVDMFGGKDPASERKWQAIEHKKSIEKMCYFGRRHSMTGAGGLPQTFSGGLEFFVSSNIWDLNGQRPSEPAFEEFLEETMRWGKGGSQNGQGTKYLLGSSRWMSAINSWAKDRLEYTVLDKQIGFAAYKYVSVHGILMLLHSPILDEDHKDMAFIIDPNHCRYVHLQERDTHLRKDIEDPGVDGSEEEWLSDVSCQVEMEGAHAILKNLPA